jgi:hypothetical protein
LCVIGMTTLPVDASTQHGRGRRVKPGALNHVTLPNPPAS